MSEDIYRIIAPHFVAALIVDHDSNIIIRSAPILAWARGKSFKSTEDYFNRKKWEIELIDRLAVTS
jgi:hypothetical protein